MAPEVLDRVEFWSIGGQELEFEPALLGQDEFAHKLDAMLAQSVPDHKQIPVDVSQQMSERDHDLGLRMAPGNSRKQKLHHVTPAIDESVFQLKWNWKHRGLLGRGRRSHTMRPFAQSAFVDEDDGLVSVIGPS